MSELRRQMSDAVLVRGFSPRTHKSYLAAISRTIVIEGVSATELVRFWPTSAPGPAGNGCPLSALQPLAPQAGVRPTIFGFEKSRA